MKNSKNKLFLGLGLVILVIVGLFGYLLVGKKAGSSEADTRVSPSKIEPINTIPVSNRPYIKILPRKDGREVSLYISRLEGSASVAYELEYQAGTLLQGAFGEINFNEEESPAKRDILLGSCSAGGKCSFHENVNGGSLVLKYQGESTTKLKDEWNFQNSSESKGKFNSRDGKFTFSVGPRGLAANTFVVIAQTMGLPAPIEGEVVGGPYEVSLAPGVSFLAKQAELTLRTGSEDSRVSLFSWTDGTWEKIEAAFDDKTLTASVTGPAVFVAVIPPALE